MQRNLTRLLVLTAISVIVLAVSPAGFAGAQEAKPQVTGSPGILTPDYPYLAPDVLAFRDQAARYLSGRVSLMAQGLDADSESIAGEGQTGPVASAQGAPDSQGGVLVPYRDPSARFSRNILIPTDFSAAPIQTEPHLAVDPDDPDHIVAGMIDYNFPGTTMYVTYDGGVTWEGPAVIKRPREELGAGGDPVLAFDREGSIYNTFISLDIEEFTVGNLLGSAVVSSMALSSSSDGGFTWTQGSPAVRSGVTSEFEIDTLGRTRGTVSIGFLDKPWLAVGPNPDDPDSDIIYISYTHFNTMYRISYTDELAFLSNPVLQTTIEVVSSEDGGISWSDPVVVSPTIRQVFEFGGSEQVTIEENPEALQSPDAIPGGQVIESLKRIVQGSYVATHDDGTVYVSWMDSSDDGPFEGLAQMYVAKSEDGGDTFEDGRQAASYLELGFSPRSSFYRFWGSSFSRLAVGPNEELYVAFSAAPSGDPSDDADVMFIRSMDEGRTWSRPPLRINDDRTSGIQFFPSIDVSPDGKIHVMWADTRDDPGIDLRYHIYYAVSEDNGESFSINSRVTDSASNPNFGFTGGRFIGDYMGIAATDEDVYLVWPDTRLGEFQGTNQKIGFARMRQMPSPSIFLSPARGASATTVTIQGFNFQADQDIFILVSGVLISTIESNDEGRFTTQLFFPTAGEGPQSVAVFDASGNSATASFYNEFGFDNLQQTAADIADIKNALSSDTLATIQEALERIESGETDNNGAAGGCGTGNATADMALVGLIALGIIGAVQLNARRRRRANNGDGGEIDA